MNTEAKETVAETEPAIKRSKTEAQATEAGGEAVTEADRAAIEGIACGKDATKVTSAVHVMQDLRTFDSLQNVELAFEKHLQFLEENIDPDSGLLDKLSANKTLSRRETSHIIYQYPFYKRNCLLFQYIIEKKKYDCLMNALKETGQSHIVNFLIGNGDYIPDKFGDDWPLSDSELRIFNANQQSLVDQIDPVNLVERLCSSGVINEKQRNEISSQLARYEKNEALLEILRRRSQKDFKVTIRCLHETNQSHVAQILERGGVVVRVHSEGLDDRMEDEIIASVANILSNKPLEESRRILEGTLNVIALKKGE